MKKLTTMLALAAMVMAASCQKDDASGSSTSGQQADVAYVSISIDSSATRAATDESQDGTSSSTSIGGESKIYSLALIAFDYNYNYIGAYSIYADADGKFNREVAADARRFFAVVNPTDEIWTAISAVSSFSQDAFSSLPAVALTAASVSTENYISNSSEIRGFTMMNCGSKNTAGILLESLVTINKELSEDVDNPTSVPITVDRMVAKFEHSISGSFDTNTTADSGGVGEVLGVALTATNKASYIYSMIHTDDLDGGNVYRTDHNMTVGLLLVDADDIRDALIENFNWLKNEDETTDSAFANSSTSTPEYVLENTCEPSYSDSNNLTQAIVKATFNPVMSDGKVASLGTSWFKINTTLGNGTLYLYFDEVVDIYNGVETYGFDVDNMADPVAFKASMDAQLNNILDSTGRTWDNVTLTELDAADYGGYKAATVADESDYIIQYYQNAVNYYDIFIQHDDSQPVDHVGRWGMVRNNSYTMSITGILKEGLPYIPDPTDPDIVDPENPDPTDPEPADKLNTYISVSITVNPWVLWYQESTLQ